MVNNRKPVFTTFYTDTRYMQHFWHLFDTAQKVGVSIEPHFVKCRGSWQKNTQYKAQFLLDKRLDSAYDGRPIVWVDVDARFREYPVLLDLLESKGVDIAAHRFLDRELCSGTLFINDTPAAVSVLRAWVERCRNNPKELDQKSLERVLESNHSNSPSFEFYALPPEYCFIFDLSRLHYPDSSPVIEHMQASRQATNKKG